MSASSGAAAQGAPGSIAACIVCHDEEDRLGPCLESVAWADETIVLDLASTDGSAALAAGMGARVVPHPPARIVEWVRNEAASHARSQWVLVLDPDERVTPGLAAELRAAALRPEIDAVVVPRMNCDLGHPPSNPRERYEPQLRMYRRDRVRWPEVPHAVPEVAEQRLHRVPARDELVLVHDRHRNVAEVLDRAVRYAPLHAQAMLDRGETFTARAMLTDLARRAYRQFIQGRAWRDGVPGFFRTAVLLSYHMYVWAAFWQLCGGHRTPADDRLFRRLGALLAAPRGVLELAGHGFFRLRGVLRPRRGPD